MHVLTSTVEMVITDVFITTRVVFSNPGNSNHLNHFVVYCILFSEHVKRDSISRLNPTFKIVICPNGEPLNDQLDAVSLFRYYSKS